MRLRLVAALAALTASVSNVQAELPPPPDQQSTQQPESTTTQPPQQGSNSASGGGGSTSYGRGSASYGGGSASYGGGSASGSGATYESNGGSWMGSTSSKPGGSWTGSKATSSTSGSSGSTSESGSSEMNVGDMSGSSGSSSDWWVSDGGSDPSGSWETLPLSWMGEFDPGWTNDMPYPALETVFRPTLAGQKELRPARKFYLNSSSVATMESREHWSTIDCPRRICLNITVHSQYGALSDFEAFVLDRIESKGELEAEGFEIDGPARLIRGQITLEELERVFGELGSFNASNDTSSDARIEYDLLTASATSWMLYPRYDFDTDEIEVTMSFKQLYTLLPGYDPVGRWLEGSGPYHSDDPNDQVIIHLYGQRPSALSSSSGMFPLVVNSTGSTMFAVDYEASLSSDDHIINLDLSFARKRYGAIPPWVPGDVSEECKANVALLMENDDVGGCIMRFVSDERIKETFLSTLNSSSDGWNPAISMNRAADECFGRRYLQDVLAREQEAEQNLKSSTSSSGYGSVGWNTDPSAGIDGSDDGGARGDFGFQLDGPLKIVKQSDEAVRGLIALNCSIGSREFASSAGKMNILKHEPTSVRVIHPVPDYSLYLELYMDNSSFFTPTFSTNDSEYQVVELIQSSIPYANDYNLDISVTFGDNLALIAEMERKNEWIHLHFPDATDPTTSSQSFTGDSGSFDDQRRWNRRLEGSYDSYRYRTFDSSFEDDGSSSGKWRHHHQGNDAGDAGGDQPSLFYVPPPEYYVEIAFRNVSIVPRVWGVFSGDGSYDFRVERQTRNVYVGTGPLQVQSFQYVPPPEGLDLFWYEDVDETNDTCVECQDLALACWNDDNCRFGVETYLLDAMEHIMSADKRDEYVDITYIFRQAQSFFPQDGFEKMNRVVTCLATRSPPCDLDRPHPLQSMKSGGEITRAPPTHFQISPAIGEFGLELGSIVNIFRSINGWWSGFYESGNASAFEDFFISDVMRLSADEFYSMGGIVWSYNDSSMNTDGLSDSNSDGGWDGVNVGDWSGGSNTDDATVQFENLVKHWVSLGNTLEDFPTVVGAQALSTTPWMISMSMDGHFSDQQRLDGSPLIQWQRVLDWISELRSWSSQTTIDTPPLPLSGNTICPQCRASLTACVTDYDCSLGVRKYVIPSMLSHLEDALGNTFGYVGFRLQEEWSQWAGNFSSPSSFGKFVNLYRCLQQEECAIGWSLDNSRSWEPTTLDFKASTSVELEYWGWMEIEYEGTTLSYSASAYGDAGQFIHDNLLQNDTEMHWYSFPIGGNSTLYYFYFYNPMIAYPKFRITSGEGSVSDSRTVWIDTYFNNQTSPQQVLSGVMSWFPPSSTTNASDSSSSKNTTSDIWTAPFSSSDACMNCAGALQRCMQNSLCRFVVTSNLLPNWLTPSSAFVNSNIFISGSWIDTSLYTYTGDLMPMIDALRDQLTNEEAWLAFAGIFPCLASEFCDLRYMTDAVDVPATSHQPTYLVFKPASVTLILSHQDKITVFINDNEFSYIYDDTAGVWTFTSWLQQELSIYGVAMEVTSAYFPDGITFQYDLSLGEYVGTPPIFQIQPSDPLMGVVTPIVTPWRVDIQSNNIAPEWSKLNDLLSFMAVHTLTIENPDYWYQCNECEGIRDQFLNDFWLKFALNSQVIPMLNNAASTVYPDEGVHELDLTNDLFWNVLPSVNSWTRPSVLELLRCVADEISPGSSCIVESSERGARGAAVAKVIVQDAYSEITVPVGTYVSCSWDGMFGTVAYNGDPVALGMNMAGNLFSSDSGVNVVASADTSTKDGQHHLTITYQKLPTLSLPHCSADTPDAFVQSIDYPQKYALQSSTSPLGEPFMYWIQWLQGNYLS